MSNQFAGAASQIDARRLAFLYDIVTSPGAFWEDSIPRLLRFGCATFGMESGALFRHGEGAGQLVAAASGDVLPETCPTPPEFSALGTGWENHSCFRTSGSVVQLGIRIVVGGCDWGALVFRSPQPRNPVFQRTDLQFLELMAGWLGQALEREEKQQQLQDLSEWQRVILESASYSIIATDRDGLILNFNAAAERLLGYRAEEVVGKHTPALIHDPAEIANRATRLSYELNCDIEPGFDVFIAKARQGEREEQEWTYIRKDGGRVPVLLSVSALTNADGRIRGFLGIAVDLTLRKQLEAGAAAAQAYEMSHGMIRAIAEGIFCLDPLPPYRVRFANPFGASLLNLPESAIAGLPLKQVLAIQTHNMEGVESLFAGLRPLDSIAFEADVASPGRPEFFFADITIARTDATAGGLLVLTLQDITLRRQTEQSLRLFGKMFEVSGEAIMITDVCGRILNVNPAFTWLTGYRPDEVIGHTPRILKSGVHDDEFYNRLWSRLLSEGSWSGEIWDRRKDGSLYPKWATINAVWENGLITHFVSLFHDISESKAHESRIKFLAEHDALTGLPNRRVLENRASQLIASERRGDRGFAVVLLDLDRFKLINDTLGHQVGDQVLIEVARRLVQGVRVTDTVVRLGGDEFVILLAGISEPSAVVEVVSKLHRGLGEPIRYEGRSLRAPPSMGIALHPGDGGDIETLLRHADAAMYQAKANGRNGWTFYTMEMNNHMEERLFLEEALRQALDEESLTLHFQPLLDAVSGTILSWEALLRWQHPELGAVSPEKIIPIAEETGLIHQLGSWVIHAACRAVRRWEEEGLGQFRVSVNVSPVQLEQDGLEQIVQAALLASGLEPQRLELEITESILMSHSPRAVNTLQNLRRCGVLVTLDDFGTGYSSLSYLKNLAVDRVKIDRSFVQNVTTDRGDASIVQAVVSLANNLDLSVVAEGVETPEQHAFLLHHGCAEVQGFLLGHPMPSTAVGDFMAASAVLPAAAESKGGGTLPVS